MLLTATLLECFTGPERQRSKTHRIQYCLILQPLLYLFPQWFGKPHNSTINPIHSTLSSTYSDNPESILIS